MGSLRKRLDDLPLRKSIVLYISAFAVLALVLSAATAALCDYTVGRICASYPTDGEKFYLTTEAGERLGEGAYISQQSVPLSERDKRLTTFLGLVPLIATPLYSASCILAAALLFYQNKLKRPLSELRRASEKIAGNDLDFSLAYESRDELGRLCASFELMRATLQENFREMWRQVEERRQLNAAFAHDLRTPLTVLKGYKELLQASEQAETREIADTMGRHISRMEAYVSSMSRLQRMEDAQPLCETVALRPLLSSLTESAGLVCERQGKALRLMGETPDGTLSLDGSFVAQVCDNLISNAARYARREVTLSFAVQPCGLRLTVGDDGEGFAGGGLSRATAPYFTGEADRSEHFGLGLYISKLLCERHGGRLQIENTGSGAQVTAFFQSCPPGR